MPKYTHPDPMADEHVLVEEDYKSGTLERTTVHISGGDIAVYPVELDVPHVRLHVPWISSNLTPEEAYWLGDTLMEHARSLGFDAEKED